MSARRQRGVALISALLVAAIAAAAAAAIASRERVEIQRSRYLLAHDQTGHYSRAAVALARDLLADSLGEAATVHRGQRWATPLQGIPIDQGHVSAELVDLQARLNLNNLRSDEGAADREHLARLQRLLASLELPRDIAAATGGWVAGQRAFRNAPSASVYLDAEPSFRPAGRPMAGISELRSVAGVDGPAYARLVPHVTALPARTPVNVNTAGPAVLAALAEGLTRRRAERLIDQHREAPFDDIGAFREAVTAVARERVADNIPEQAVSVSSRYFRLHIVAELGGTKIERFALLRLGADDAAAQALRISARPM